MRKDTPKCVNCGTTDTKTIKAIKYLLSDIEKNGISKSIATQNLIGIVLNVGL